jgi:pyridoxamine 5'-phosphate oxidase family protein
MEKRPTMFTVNELAYIRGERRLWRIATVGPGGMPHVTPVGMVLWNEELATMDVGGHNVERTKKFRDVARSGHAALVVDDVVPPWQPRGIEIRGEAEAVAGPPALIRVRPVRIVSWGLGDARVEGRNVPR